MLKFAVLPLSVCLALTSCQLFKKSETWDRVTQVRVQPGAGTDPSSAHAQKLHEVLQAGGVEHKVVNYTYSYVGAGGEPAIGSRVAVIYRDDTNARSPWWLMDNTMRQPAWLPNEAVEKQVGFVVRKPVTLTSVDEYRPGAGDQSGSRMASTSRRESSTSTAVTRDVSPVVQSRQDTSATTSPEPRSAASAFGAIGESIRAIPRLLGIRRVDQSEAEMSRRTTPPQTPERTSAPDYVELFRARHGTFYDSASSIDRQKMALLKGRTTAKVE